MKRARTLRVTILALALVVMVVLIARLGPREIGRQLASAGPAAVWLLVVYLAGTAITAMPWYVLLPRGARPRPVSAIASRLAASGANAIVPLLGLGGEPARLLWLAPEDRAIGVGAIVIDRLLYAFASGMFLLAGVVAVVQMTSFPAPYAIAAAIAVAVLAGGTAIGGWLVARHKIAARIHGLLRRVRRQTATPASGFGVEVDDSIEEIVGHRGAVVGATAIHLGGRVVLAAEVLVGFWVLGWPLAWDEALAFASVPVLLALVGAVVPSQIALQEGAQALVATALGIPPAVAVAVVLLQRIRQLVTGGMAWWLIAAKR